MNTTTVTQVMPDGARTFGLLLAMLALGMSLAVIVRYATAWRRGYGARFIGGTLFVTGWVLLLGSRILSYFLYPDTLPWHPLTYGITTVATALGLVGLVYVFRSVRKEGGLHPDQ